MNEEYKAVTEIAFFTTKREPDEWDNEQLLEDIAWAQ